MSFLRAGLYPSYALLHPHYSELSLVCGSNSIRVCHTEWSKSEKNKYHLLTYICGIYKNGTDEPICIAGTETLIYRTDMRTQEGKEKVGWIGKLGLTYTTMERLIIGRTDVEAETLVLWPPDAKSWRIWKDPDARKDWRQEEKGTTEDEMAGWHHRLNGHGFGWTPGVDDGQGGLACCGSWDRKESDRTERLSWLTLPCVN